MCATISGEAENYQVEKGLLKENELSGTLNGLLHLPSRNKLKIELHPALLLLAHSEKTIMIVK